MWWLSSRATWRWLPPRWAVCCSPGDWDSRGLRAASGPCRLGLGQAWTSDLHLLCGSHHAPRAVHTADTLHPPHTCARTPCAHPLTVHLWRRRCAGPRLGGSEHCLWINPSTSQQPGAMRTLLPTPWRGSAPEAARAGATGTTPPHPISKSHRSPLSLRPRTWQQASLMAGEATQGCAPKRFAVRTRELHHPVWPGRQGAATDTRKC